MLRHFHQVGAFLVGIVMGLSSGMAAAASSTVSITVYTNSTNNTIYTPVGGEKGASVWTAPAHGTVSIVGYSVFYTPTAGYTGADSFTYIINTTSGGVNYANQHAVNVTVTLPPPPTANAVSSTVAANSNANAVTLSTSGTVTSVAVASQAAHGTATASGTSISYTPTAGYSGTDSFTYTASNVGGTSSAATATITVTRPTLTLTPSSLAAGTQGTAYSQSLGASLGTGPYTYAISTGSLPGGLTLSSAGSLSGTPTASGTFSFSIQATDVYGATGVQSYTLQLAPIPLPVANPTSTSVAANSSANPVPLNMTGGTASSVAVAVQAAHGTAAASGTTITYTPTAGYSGGDSFSYTATNASGTSSAAAVTVTVTQPTLGIAPSSLPSGMVNTTYSQNLTASLGTAPYSYAVISDSLPAGLSLSSAGSISGTPTASGSFSFTVQATDLYGATGVRSYTLSIAVQLPVANDVSATVAANSGANPIMLSTTGPVSSVAVASQATHGMATASGASISYMPTAGYSGPDSFTYTAANSSGTSNVATVTLSVSAPTLTLAPSSLPAGMVATAYSQSLSASLGSAPYSYVVSLGTLPSGLSLDAPTGQITGTPSSSGTASFTVQATDRYGAIGSQSYTLQISAIPVPVTSASGMTVAANSGASPVTLAITGGTPTSVAVAGQAAHGTATASGTSISYMPTAGFSGQDSFTYTASNAGGTSNTSTVTMTVSAPTLTFVSSSLPAGTQSQAYSQTLAASQGAAPYTYAISAGNLPSGLVLGSDGSLSGTPTVSGTFSFTVEATDSNGAKGSQIYTLTITVAAPVANDVSATVAANSSANAITLNITRATASSVAVVSQATHGTATASGTSISYTPAAGYSGGDSFTYTATNASGTSSPATVTITVSEPVLAIAPGSLPSGVVGTAYSQNLTASLGTAPYSCALSAGSLPSGLSLSSAGSLSGTPSTGGSFSVTVQVTDSYGATGTQTYTLAIAAQMPVANAVTATVAANSSDNVIMLSTTGANSVAVNSQALHGTATATASGNSISYTPIAGYSGSDSFTYTATNTSGTSSPATVTVTVTAPTLTLAPSSLMAGVVGTAYSQTVSASLGTAPYSYVLDSGGGLPTGLSIDPASGQISGTPSSSGTFSFTVKATDSYAATGSQAYTLSITVPAPVANDVSATVAANSSNNVIALNITRATASSVAVASQAAHGVATVSGTGTGISYTPTAGFSGQDSFTYTASNASGSSSAATVTVTVTTSTLAIAPGSLPSGVANTAYSQSLTASLGTAPYGYSIGTGSLPAGLSLSSTGSLSGTPTANGSFSFTVQVSDSYGATGAQSYTLAIAVQPPVANNALASVAANSGATSVTLNITGGQASSVAVASQATHGTATASGTSISYTPAAGFSGSDSFTYTATNASGTSSPATVTVTVSAPTLTISPSSLTAATVGLAYNQALTASQGAAPYSYTVIDGALPAGLSLNPSTGQITGTATVSGSFSFTVQVKDSNGALGSQIYALSSAQPVPVANAVSATVAANSGANDISLNITRAAASSVAVASQAGYGTAMASGTSISYAPAAGYSGTDSFTYTASNASGSSGAATVTVTVTEPSLSMAPSALPQGMVDTAYNQNLAASMGTAPYRYTLVSGSLPNGLSLGSDGSISGTPKEDGSFSFTAQATDSHNATGTQVYKLAIAVALPVANNASATVAANSSSNAITLNTVGTVNSVAVASQAQHGTATASGNSISYTPAAGYSGGDSFTYTATNASGTSSAATVDITITAPTLTMGQGSLPAATAGVAYSQTLTASQGTAPYTYAITTGALPAGLSLDTATGQITGTPSTLGSFSFTVGITDHYGATGSQSYTLQVTGTPVPVANPSSMTVAANSTANPVSLDLTGGASTSVALFAQATHGVALVSGTSISYTPTAGYSGPDDFSYTASNAGGTSAAAKVTIQVTASTLAIAPSTLAAATEGRPYSQGLTASQGTAPYTYTIIGGALPGGLVLGSDGSLSGTPTVNGTFSFTLQVADSLGAIGSQAYTLTSSLPAPVANDVSATVVANSNANTIALNITRAVASSVAVVSQAVHGMATASGAVVSYTPTTGYSGMDTFTYTATNASGTSGVATVTVTITDATLTITPNSLPAGIVGTVYSQVLTASLGSAPYAYTISTGALPEGLSLNSVTGLLAGTPTAAGSFSFTVLVTDVYQATGPQSYTLQIVAMPASVTRNASMAVAANSRANPVQLGVLGSVASVVVTVQAVHGIASASGASLNYTPNTGYSGVDTFSYTVTDDSGALSAVTVAVQVSPLPLSATEGRLPDAVAGASYNHSLAISGGTAPYVFAVGSGVLPPGLTLSASGQITGTPQSQALGSFAFTIVVTDAQGASRTLSYSLRVSQAVPIAPTLSARIAANGSVELDVSASATGKPLTGADLISLTPADAGKASLRSAASVVAGDGPVYLVSFTAGAAFSGSALISYSLSNTAGTSAPGEIHIQVTARTDPSKDAEVAGMVAAQISSAHRFASVQIANFSRRLESLHADGWGRSDMGLTLDTGRQPELGQEDRVLGRSPLAGMRRTSARIGVATSNLPDLPSSDGAGGVGKQALAFWVGGTVKYGREYVRNVDTKYRFTTSGISAGADYRVSDLWTLGLGLGLGRDSSYVGENGSQSTADNQLTVLLYTSLRPGGKVFVDGLLGHGRLHFDSSRYITDGGGTAQGTRSGNFMLGSLIAGMEFRQPGWMWSPYARLEVVQLTLDTYSESAAGLAALTYYAQQSSVRNAVLGLRAEGLYALRWGSLMPRIRLEYARNMQRNGEAGLAYTDLAYLGPAYAISPFSFSTGNWSLGLGARLQTRRGVEFSLELNLGFASGSQSRSMSLGLRVPF
ncbi:putative Ig domain-containing protein [Comamonas sp. GB3 AK4-5]|uniref:Ig-like domain-containing protein n=1 Tax=Comamonas sp. GB3 AK4-5 TaxID=3231487 RepID=UPI00351F6904